MSTEYIFPPIPAYRLEALKKEAPDPHAHLEPSYPGHDTTNLTRVLEETESEGPQYDYYTAVWYSI